MMASGPSTLAHDREYESVIEATVSWVRSRTGDWDRWEPRSLPAGNGDALDRFASMIDSLSAEPTEESLEQARSQGISDDQARDMLKAMAAHMSGLREQATPRNRRYAVLRDLFERSLEAAPDDVRAALDDLGVSAMDMQRAFDGLAMSYGSS
jgi:hypothetical protein